MRHVIFMILKMNSGGMKCIIVRNRILRLGIFNYWKIFPFCTNRNECAPYLLKHIKPAEVLLRMVEDAIQMR